MTIGSWRECIGAVALPIACLLSAVPAFGQAHGDTRPAEQLFQNVRFNAGCAGKK